MFRITLCADPADDREAEQSGFDVCHLAYHIDAGGRLYRGALGVNVSGGLLGISDRDVGESTPYDPSLVRELRRECDARGYSGVLCDFERPPTPMLTRFAYEAAVCFAAAGMTFCLPEAYASAAPGATLLISSAISGGDVDEVLRKAVARYGADRVALEFAPVCMDFAMPAPRSGDADCVSPTAMEEILRRENAVAYFSHELCANYFTYRTSDGESRFAVFDDARSMLKKLDAARRAGFREAFICYPDACGELDELRGLCDAGY